MSETPEQVCLEDIFTCTRCGYCCQGETTVSLDPQDQERMIRTLGLPAEEVRRRYWRVNGDTVQMQVVDSHCIFYDPESGCTVHAGRPWRCGQWPLHPSILKDESNFTAIRNSCPGINQELSYTEFCHLFRKLLAKNQRLIC